MKNVKSLIIAAACLTVACTATTTQYVARSQTKAPAIAKQRVDGPVLLSIGADMGQLHSVATTNGQNLNMCLTSLSAAQEYFEKTGQ